MPKKDMYIECTCKMCGKEVDIIADQRGYNKWKKGMLIQDAMPYLTPDEREILVSGICGECFDNLFK